MPKKKLFLLLFIAAPFLGLAQPKMHIKAWVGLNTHTFNYRAENVESDFFPGWQGGFGFRIRQQRLFGELDFGFMRYEANVPIDLEIETDSILSTNVNVVFNSFELPLLAGYVPVKTPLFKWYLQGGIVNRFSIRENLTIDELGINETLRPKDIGLPVYNLLFRLGTQVDIAMINLGFNYSINLTNAVRDVARTNVHILMLDVGIIF